MQEDPLRAYIAGSFSAFQNVLLMLIHDLEAAKVSNRALIMDRVKRLAEALEAGGVSHYPLHDQAAAKQLRSLLGLLEIQPDRPSWKPEVIEGGREKSPPDAES